MFLPIQCFSLSLWTLGKTFRNWSFSLFVKNTASDWFMEIQNSLSNIVRVSSKLHLWLTIRLWSKIWFPLYIHWNVSSSSLLWRTLDVRKVLGSKRLHGNSLLLRRSLNPWIILGSVRSLHGFSMIVHKVVI